MKRGAWSTVRMAVAALLLTTLAACAQPRGPAIESDAAALAPPPEGLARIFFYRTSNPLMAMVEPAVVVNDRKVGTIGPGEVFYRDARPGRYRVLIDTAPEAPLTFRVAAGDRRFVRIMPAWDMLGWSLTAGLVERADAENDMRGLTVTARPSDPPPRQ